MTKIAGCKAHPKPKCTVLQETNRCLKGDGAAVDKLSGEVGAPKLGPCVLADFDIGKVLGTGSFGRVSLAFHRATGVWCALKTLVKAHVVRNQQLPHLLSERDVLRSVDHPFVVRMLGCFQDADCVHLVMEFVAGGEFFSHLRARGKLTEDVAKFYAAQVVLVFEYLHSNSIVYRDLKPENMLLDAQGYLKLTDFGFAKELPGAKRTYTLCGTPDYLAPEIILNKGHGRAVDWWALGVLIYEMLAGYPPFCDDDAMGTYNRILRGTLSFPTYFSAHARDLVRRLLQADLSKRFGCLAGGAADIKQHAWFRSVDFAGLKARRLQAPIQPPVRSQDDTSNFDDYGKLPPLIGSGGKLTEAEQTAFEGF